LPGARPFECLPSFFPLPIPLPFRATAFLFPRLPSDVTCRTGLVCLFIIRSEQVFFPFASCFPVGCAPLPYVYCLSPPPSDLMSSFPSPTKAFHLVLPKLSAVSISCPRTLGFLGGRTFADIQSSPPARANALFDISREP